MESVTDSLEQGSGELKIANATCASGGRGARGKYVKQQCRRATRQYYIFPNMRQVQEPALQGELGCPMLISTRRQRSKAVKTTRLLTCFILSTWPGLSIATDLASENKRILDHFFEDPNVTPLQMKQLLSTVYQQKKLEADSLKFQGPPVSVPPTRVRVKGHNPPCGNNDKPPQAQLAEAFTAGGATMLASAGIGAAAGVVGVGAIAAIGATIGTVGLILGGGDTYQEVGNCSLSCTAVPGHYERDELAKIVDVTYTYNRGDGSPSRPMAAGDTGDWSVTEEWISDKRYMTAEYGSALRDASLIKKGLELAAPPTSNAPLDCPITLVCSRVKNWSANYQRSFAVTVTADIRHIASGACLDPSLINRDRYARELVRALPGEYVQKYYATMRDRINAQPK